ncbi:hypothetical protein [Sabulicella rubraurantiaca]|uniref:hypothetical protein n=1 Tax=Sabulicella rubraurantiaca TaxID=2811429 RepID=UPI001A97251E|nr:hypothetical protein [Sabulicella rubraurantiaca]
MREFKGRPPGAGAGDMSRLTEALRPSIALTPRQAGDARRMRREGKEPPEIAALLDVPMDEVEKALCQMRMPRPETTRGTLNVTLAAHAVVMRERQGNEPLWVTMDRLLDELFRLRAEAGRRVSPPRNSARRRTPEAPLLDLMGSARRH